MNSGLPQSIIGLVRNFISLGEKQAISDQFMYYRIMSEFEDNNYHVKKCEKARLKDKFHWLLLNYYPYSVRDDGQNYDMPDPSTRPL